jgi:hypothetical protein
MTEQKSYTLEVLDAVLTYDVRGNGSSSEPVLLLIGSPMGAAGFGTLSKQPVRGEVLIRRVQLSATETRARRLQDY